MNASAKSGMTFVENGATSMTTSVTRLKIRIVPIVATLALFLAGCDQNTDETASDTEVTRNTSTKSIVGAQKDTGQEAARPNRRATNATQNRAIPQMGVRAMPVATEAGKMIDKKTDEYDLAITKAEEIYELAIQECNRLDGIARTNCMDAANEALAAANIDAAAKRDMSQMAAKPAE
jgi:PBP1b-binding outer membrane lipoprotein LpoB